MATNIEYLHADQIGGWITYNKLRKFNSKR